MPGRLNNPARTSLASNCDHELRALGIIPSIHTEKPAVQSRKRRSIVLRAFPPFWVSWKTHPSGARRFRQKRIRRMKPFMILVRRCHEIFAGVGRGRSRSLRLRLDKRRGRSLTRIRKRSVYPRWLVMRPVGWVRPRGLQLLGQWPLRYLQGVQRIGGKTSET